jgi:hypothetical protein
MFGRELVELDAMQLAQLGVLFGRLVAQVSDGAFDIEQVLGVASGEAELELQVGPDRSEALAREQPPVLRFPSTLE